MSSNAYLDGFFQKPRVDFDLLEQHHEGLVGTTGCLGGAVSQALLKGDYPLAQQHVERFQSIFGRDSFFVELQDHGLPEQLQVNPQLIKLAREMRAPLLATNDSHYTHRHDAEAHDALLCVQTGALQSDPKRFKFDADEFYLKTASEMRALFADYEEACDNTLLIAERAAVEIEFGNAVLPSFPTPPGHDEDSFLRELCIEGAKERYGISPGPEALERIEFELGVIKTMGFSAYFLIVWDLVRYARTRGIRVGPGRGSAAGSCVAYCLRIVDIDPIKYDLLFERFLNPGRKQMPDIDMDFDSRYRGEMIKYAAERYGWDHVAQIVTFSTIKARAAVRDSARVLGYPYIVGDKIAKLMPPLIMGRDTPLRACFEKVTGHEDGYKMASELRTLYEADPDAKRVIDVARGLEGLRRQDGIHAAAVVITREPLTEYLPDPAQAGGRRQDRGRADRHPVRDARGRRPRPPQDGLPGAAQPRRPRDRPRSHRRAHRLPTRHRPCPARRRRHLRPPPARRHRRRVPAGGRAHARAAPLARAHRVRGRRRPHRALPPGPDGAELAQRVRRPQERSQAGLVPARRPARGPRAHLRADDLPGAADARRAAARRLLAGGGRQPPQGHRQEDPRAHRQGAHQVRRGVRRQRAHRGRSATTSST